MDGVDHVNQQLHSINILRKLTNGTRNVLFRLTAQYIFNAYKVYLHHTNNTTTFHKFHQYSILATRDDVPQEATDNSTSCLVGCHFSMQLERPATKRCRICETKNKKTSGVHTVKTVFICKTYQIQPRLHPREYFEIYHMVLDFKE